MEAIQNSKVTNPLRFIIQFYTCLEMLMIKGEYFEVLVVPSHSKFVIMTKYGLKYHKSAKIWRNSISIQLA